MMTVSDAIDRLGAENVINLLGITQSGLRNYRFRNAFPPRVYMVLAAYAKRRGVVIPTALFRETPDPRWLKSDNKKVTLTGT